MLDICYAHLKPVLSSVPTASNMKVESFDRDECGLAKGELLEVVQCELLEVLRGTGTLERKQAPVVEYFELDLAVFGAFARIPLCEFLLEPWQVAVAATGVGDDIKRVGSVLRDNGIVDYATVLIEEDGESRAVGLERGEGRWGEPFEELGYCRTAEAGGSDG